MSPRCGPMLGLDLAWNAGASEPAQLSSSRGPGPASGAWRWVRRGYFTSCLCPSRIPGGRAGVGFFLGSFMGSEVLRARAGPCLSGGGVCSGGSKTSAECNPYAPPDSSCSGAARRVEPGVAATVTPRRCTAAAAAPFSYRQDAA